MSVYVKVTELMGPKQSTCKGKGLSQRGGKGLCEGMGERTQLEEGDRGESL